MARRSEFLGFAACLGSVLISGPASAQPIVVTQGPRQDAWASALNPGSSPQPQHEDAVSPERLESIGFIDQTLAAAWEDVSLLRLRSALARLARAREVAESHADLPSMAAWLAEVEAMTAIISSQMAAPSWQALTDQSLQRMSSLDASRVLRPAEAPPTLVARAEAALRAVRAAPPARFELEASVPDAVAFLDGERLGPLPLTVETRAGRHHLRVFARDHHAYGVILDLEPGQSAGMNVRFSPLPYVERRARIATAQSLAEARALLAETDELIWAETRATGRALVVRCTATGCSAAERQLTPSWPINADSRPIAMDAADLEWLDEEPPRPPPPPKPWHRRWGVWAGIGTAVAVGVAVIVRSAQREAEPAFRATLNFGDTNR